MPDERRRLHYKWSFNDGTVVLVAGLLEDSPVVYCGPDRRRGDWPLAIPPNVAKALGDNWQSRHPNEGGAETTV